MALPRLTACLLSLGALSLGGPAGAVASPPADIAGYYRLPESDLPPAPPAPVIVEIYGCGDAQFCGRIAGHGDGVFAQTLTGLNRLPVYVDAPKYERIGVLEAGRHKIQN